MTDRIPPEDTARNAARNGLDAPVGSIANVAMQTWCYGNAYHNSIEIIQAIGLDPLMTLDELRELVAKAK